MGAWTFCHCYRVSFLSFKKARPSHRGRASLRLNVGFSTYGSYDTRVPPVFDP